MAASDLSKPLGQQHKTSIPKSRIFMFGSLGGLTALLVALFSWILLADTPNGGLPIQQIDLKATLAGSQRIGVDSIRPGIKPGIPETTFPDEILSQSTQQPLEALDNTSSNSGEVRVLDPNDPLLNQLEASGKTAAYQVFSRPVNADAIAGLPKITVIIDGLGLSQTTTEEALTLLPPDITLAFAPYGNSLARWTRRARSQGHELLVQVPLEPFDYPNNDPGPHTLLASANADTNKANLHWILGRLDEYVGVINYMGARFATDELAGSEFIRELKTRGLLFVENGASVRSRLSVIASTMSLPNLKSDLVLDTQGGVSDIETRLVQLESIAQENGFAIGVASALPSSIRSISDWSQSLRKRGFALVPVTTLLQQ